MKYVLLILWALVGGNAFASAGSCGKFPDPLKGGYCIYAPDANRASGDVIYYFHGQNGNENYWGDEFYYPAQVRAEWEREGAKLPTVVSISFGPVFLLAEKNASLYSGLFNVFTAQVLPMIEAGLGGVKGRRMVMGESMGGFNTIQLALKTNLFVKAAPLCAPMSFLSPWATREEINAYALNSGAYHYYKDSPTPNIVVDSLLEMAQLAQGFYPTPADWTGADPLVLAGSSASNTQLYVSIGFYDRLAAYEPNEKFVSLLQGRGKIVDWRPQWGGHCSMDIPSLAKFLVE